MMKGDWIEANETKDDNRFFEKRVKNKEKEDLYKSAFQKIETAAKSYVQNESGKQIEILGSLLSAKAQMIIGSFEEIKESLKNLKGMRNMVLLSPEVRNKKQKGQFDQLAEILEQAYHYYNAELWVRMYQHLKGGNMAISFRSSSSTFQNSINKSKYHRLNIFKDQQYLDQKPDVQMKMRKRSKKKTVLGSFA